MVTTKIDFSESSSRKDSLSLSFPVLRVHGPQLSFASGTGSAAGVLPSKVTPAQSGPHPITNQVVQEIISDPQFLMEGG